MCSVHVFCLFVCGSVVKTMLVELFHQNFFPAKQTRSAHMHTFSLPSVCLFVSSSLFLIQCVLTLRECDQSTAEAIAQTLCYCCWNNQTFSACTIEDFQVWQTMQ